MRYKGARSSRYKVVEVQGSSRMRAWCDLPRCRPTERVRSSRCIHETQSESAEELQQASSSLLIAPSASPSSSVHPTSTLPRQGSPARVAEVRHMIGGSRDLCRRDGRGRRDTQAALTKPCHLVAAQFGCSKSSVVTLGCQGSEGV